MPSATGSQSYVAIVKQVPATPKVIPASPVMQKVNFVSDDLGTTIDTKVSDHISDDRMTADITTTGYSVGGGYNFEFQFENSLLDELLLGFLWAQSWGAGGSLSQVATNGVFYQPFFIERGHKDVTEYFKFLGMACNVMTLEMADQSDVTGSFQFIGLTSQVDQEVESGATYTSPTINPVFSTVTDMPSIKIDDVEQEGCFVKEMSVEINNNVTPKTGLGQLGACETNPHRLDITGAITMYFEDSAMYTRLLNGTAFSLSWTLTDGDANSYIFTLPRVKLDADTINVTGVDDEVMDDATFVALYDKTAGHMIQIEKS